MDMYMFNINGDASTTMKKKTIMIVSAVPFNVKKYQYEIVFIMENIHMVPFIKYFLGEK